MIDGTTATTILVFSLLGIVGFAGLLVVGMRMWGEERARKRGNNGATQAPPVPEIPVAPEAASEVKTEAPLAEAAEAPASGSVETSSAKPLPPNPDLVAPQMDFAPAPPTTEPAPAPEGKIPSLHLPFLSRAPAGQDILRMMRDPATGQVTIYIGGRPYTNFQDIQNPENEQAFTMAFRLLQAFSENTLAAPSPTSEADALLQPAEPPRPAPVAYHAAELPPPELPSMQPFRQWRNLRGKQPASTKYVVKSITEQIEDQLQDKIARTPLARRGVHVRSEPQGNAVFMLEGKTYSTVDEVPDPEVRQAIREAISEWEKKK